MRGEGNRPGFRGRRPDFRAEKAALFTGTILFATPSFPFGTRTLVPEGSDVPGARVGLGIYYMEERLKGAQISRG